MERDVLLDLYIAGFDKEVATIRGDGYIQEEKDEKIIKLSIKASRQNLNQREIDNVVFLGMSDGASEELETDLATIHKSKIKYY